MKKLLIALLIIAPSLTIAQSFTEKTNKIPLDYNRGVTPTTLPSITWVSPRIESSFSTATSVKLEARVKSVTPLKEVKLVINVSGNDVERSMPLDGSVNNFNFEQNLHLFEGGNHIRLVAINEDGGTVYSERHILMGVDDIADAVDVNRKDYALIIATDEYDNWDDLNNPINDATVIDQLLRERYGFETEVVKNPTLEEINDKLYEYNAREFNPQDQLLVFIAGHGYFDETLGEGYVVASNSLKNDRGKTSYLAHNLLRSRVNNIRCEHIMLVMDVCFGGTIDPKMVHVRGEMLEEEDSQYLVKKLTKRTRKFLTSGSKEYVPDGQPGHHSPFAAKFISALREVGGRQSRVLSTTQLIPYFLRLQTEPRFGSFGTDESGSDFVFVANSN